MKSILTQSLIELAIDIQQIAAPTFGEARRAAFIYERFFIEGLTDLSIDEINNVFARIPGSGKAPPLVISAHSDTVFPESFELSVVRSDETISGPGIGDNALGVAGLFGLIWSLRERGIELPGDLWLVANVGEEGLGDLRGMRAVVDRFGDNPLAYIIVEGMAVGQIYHRGLGVKRYRISVQTPGGHSWVDYGKPSAIHEMARVINKLIALPLPGNPRTSLNIGVISGGTSVNTIASQACIELDMRSEDSGALDKLVGQVDNLIESANQPGASFIRVTREIIGDRPVGALSKVHPLVRLAYRCLEEQGIHPTLNIGSTDANIPLSRGLPAICLGLTHGGGAHTSKEYILKAPIAQGIAQLVAIVEGAFQALSREAKN
jgi:acetylornithine deacetylase/succinyl-diaminopimelate desuccinylase-like protein